MLDQVCCISLNIIPYYFLVRLILNHDFVPGTKEMSYFQYAYKQNEAHENIKQAVRYN